MFLLVDSDNDEEDEVEAIEETVPFAPEIDSAAEESGLTTTDQPPGMLPFVIIYSLNKIAELPC